MFISSKMHRAIAECLIETCLVALGDGPHPGLASTHESEHTNGGYLTMDTLLHSLHRVLTEEKPPTTRPPVTADIHQVRESATLFCGGNYDVSRTPGRSYSSPLAFNELSISRLEGSGCAYYCCMFVNNLNQAAFMLAASGEQEYLPWCIIKQVIGFYYEKFNYKIAGNDLDPYYSLTTDMVLQGIVERVPDGPNYGDWLISASNTSMRVKWMNDIFKSYFIDDGDYLEPSWPGWRRTNGFLDPEEVSDYTSEDICVWWAELIMNSLPTDREFWGEIMVSTPQPPDYPPPAARPVTVEPVNETKKKLTEILALIEDKRETWTMNEGDYLKISDLMKEAFDSV